MSRWLYTRILQSRSQVSVRQYFFLQVLLLAIFMLGKVRSDRPSQSCSIYSQLYIPIDMTALKKLRVIITNKHVFFNLSGKSNTYIGEFPLTLADSYTEHTVKPCLLSVCNDDKEILSRQLFLFLFYVIKSALCNWQYTCITIADTKSHMSQSLLVFQLLFVMIE